MLIHLLDLGEPMSTRQMGAEARTKLETALSQADTVEVDFGGANGMTPSFADEVFGKLMDSIGPDNFRKRISLVNVPDRIKSLLRSVFATHSGHNLTASA